MTVMSVAHTVYEVMQIPVEVLLIGVLLLRARNSPRPPDRKERQVTAPSQPATELKDFWHGLLDDAQEILTSLPEEDGDDLSWLLEAIEGAEKRLADLRAAAGLPAR